MIGRSNPSKPPPPRIHKPTQHASPLPSPPYPRPRNPSVFHKRHTQEQATAAGATATARDSDQGQRYGIYEHEEVVKGGRHNRTGEKTMRRGALEGWGGHKTGCAVALFYLPAAPCLYVPRKATQTVVSSITCSSRIHLQTCGEKGCGCGAWMRGGRMNGLCFQAGQTRTARWTR